MRHLRSFWIGLAVAVCIAIGASSVPITHPWPETASTETIIGVFQVNDGTSFTATQCAPFYAPNTSEAACTNFPYRFALPRAYTITSVHATVWQAEWTLLEACDVALHIDGTIEASTEIVVGNPLLDSDGDAASISGLSIAVAAGQELTVAHNAPVPDTTCNSGESCVCTGATGSYSYMVMGVPR